MSLDESSWVWPVAIIVFSVIIAQNLWRAAATGVIEMRSWEVKRSENPAAFWFAVVTESGFILVGIWLMIQWLLSNIWG